MADERDKIRAMMGLPPVATKDPVAVGGTPFGQAGTTQAPQTPMSYGGTSFGQAGSAAPTTSNEYQSALNDFNKTLKQAEKTLALAKKSGNKNEIKAAQGYVDLLKGDISQVLKIAGGISGGTAGAAGIAGATGGKGAYSLSQIKAYMDANNGAFPPDLNTIASGITASDLGNLQNQYNAGKGLGGGAAAGGAADADAREKRQSAFDLLKLQFDEYGLGALVEPLRGLIQEGISPSEFAVRLRQTEPYKKRFAANAARISKGLRALSEAEYIGLEDGYQTIMRNYGLPASYYTKGELGRQEGFEKFIAGDVSPAELEERVVTAQKRVLDAAPEVTTALKEFYPDIKNGDILAYTLDPERGLADIKKKVTAAEIGGAALGARLGATVGRAEELARYGVTAESARAGYGAIGGGLERGRQLANIYQQPDYTQAVAEEEVFNLPGQASATQKRKKIIGLEKAEFGGQTGMTSGALSRDRAGSY